MAYPTPGSASGGQLQIGIALVLQDRFSNQARDASKELRRLHQEAKAVTNANLSTVRNFAGVGAAMGAAAVRGIADIVQEGAEFIKTMTFVDAVAVKNGVTMDELSEKAQTLGAKTMFMARDVASGMQYMAMAGMDTKEIFGSIGAAVNLAGATMIELGGKGGAADMLTNVMRMFKFETEDATRVSDVLTTVVTSSNTSMGDLAEAVKYAGTTVTNLGGSLEQMVSLIGVMGDAGIQGSMAGTAIANAYRYLSRSVEGKHKIGAKALASIGLSREDLLDAKGNLLDMGLAVQKINKQMQAHGLDPTSSFSKLIDIFGVRGEREASVLLRSAERYEALLDKVQNQSQGRAAEVMKKQMESLWGVIETAMSTLENIRIAFTVKLGPILIPFLKTFTALAEVVLFIVNLPIVGNLIAGMLTAFTVVLTLRLAFIALKSTIMLAFNDSTISLKNMFTVMRGGWKAASISAREYQAIQAGIAAQSRLVTPGMAPGSAQAIFNTAAGARLLSTLTPGAAGAVAGVYMTKGGRFYQKGENGARSRRISRDAAIGRLGEHASRAGQSAGMMGGGFLGKIGGRLGKVLGVGSMLLGGPWGIAIIAISVLLPMLIGALTKNKDSAENNTKAVKENAKATREATALTKDNQETGKTELSLAEEIRVMSQVIDHLARVLSGSPMASVTINTDGQRMMEQTLRLSEQKDVKANS